MDDRKYLTNSGGRAMTTWTGNGANNNWSTAANWSENAVPYSYENVTFQNGANVFLDQNEQVNGITVSGTVTITSNGSVLDDTNNSLTLATGARLVLRNVELDTETTSSTTSGMIELSNATLSLSYGGQFNGTIVFDTGTASVLKIAASMNGEIGALQNFGSSDEIVLSGNIASDDTVSLVLNSDSSTYSLVQTHTGWGGAQTVLSSNVTLATGATASNFALKNVNGTLIFEYTCFLAGSAIRTPTGDVAVEDLRAGDLVITVVDGREVAAPLVWVGSRQVVARSAESFPVRIRAGAFAEGVPVRDLLITPEHCVFVDGVMIPARMLVNGRSIVQDSSFTRFDVYHLETEKHSILLSEGLTTESYLDTGNRHGFQVAPGAIVPVAQTVARSWGANAAAPLGTARDVVEPVYRALEARAVSMGLADERAPAAMTDDPDLRLVTNRGETLKPLRQVNGRYMFRLPSGVRTVRIMSRVAAPADALGPFVDDRRQLGVLVGDAVLWDDDQTRVLDEHLHETALAGWHGVEQGTMRWTRGDAMLHLTGRSPVASGMLGLQILAAGPYVMNDISERAVA